MSENGQTETTTEAAEAVTVVPDMDLGDLLEGAIRKAVGAQIAAQAKDIAAGVVKAMLTPEVLAGMRETAIHEAELALNPAPELESEPEAEQSQAQEEEGEPEAQEQPRELRYASLKEFVELYVVNLYRREVSEMGKERSIRWCPQWWKHGEAVARFRAMWAAFEHLRLGGETEMSLWFLVHFDPHMERLFDPHGPFRFCSVPDGHHADDEVLGGRIKMPALPVVPVDPRLLEEDERYGSVTASGLVLPNVSVSRARMVASVDESGEWRFGE